MSKGIIVFLADDLPAYPLTQHKSCKQAVPGRHKYEGWCICISSLRAGWSHWLGEPLRTLLCPPARNLLNRGAFFGKSSADQHGTNYAIIVRRVSFVGPFWIPCLYSGWESFVDLAERKSKGPAVTSHCLTTGRCQFASLPDCLHACLHACMHAPTARTRYE